MEHKFDSQKFLLTGMVLGLARDLKAAGKFNFLQNARVITEGAIESRPCIDKFFTLIPDLPQVPHSIKTITNKITGEVLRIVGIDTEIYFGKNQTLLQQVSGFSGDPLSMIDFRPEEAIEAHAYIADKIKMCKISVDEVVSDIGINAPTKPLAFRINSPNRKIVDNIKSADVADWNDLIGSAGVPAVEDRIDTTITAILYDEAAPSYASVIATIPPTLQTGCIVTMNSADDLIVEEIIPSSLLSSIATISRISYDVGTSGLCTIALSVPDISIRRNSILLLNATEYVRALYVTRDSNGFPSVRTSTVSTHAAAETVVGAASFRVFATNVYVATNTIFAEGLVSAIGAAGISAITNTIDVDLTNANGKPLKDSDYLHCSLKVSNPSLITEIQIQLDCDSAVPFDNRFYYPITPNYFTSSATEETSTLSTIQQTIQREELVTQLLRFREQPSISGDYESINLGLEPIDYLSNQTPIGQTALGQSQWIELFIKIKDLKRVGTDASRTKKDIKGIRLSVNATAAVIVGLDSIWVGGGNDLESIRGNSSLIPYNYIYRIRDPQTGAFSNWSPPLREGILVSRSSITLTPTDANTIFPVAYVIDIARFGGTLNDYRIIGTIKNNASTFEDTVSDFAAAQDQPAGRRLSGDQIGSEEVFDFYKPFTFLDIPKLGTCSVTGTKFTWLSGDILNITYPRGVQILINGKLNRFYANPTDTTHVELEKDMGALTGVNFEIKTPLLTGQPLPMMFGPFGEGNFGLFLFAVGNNKAAGTIYWTDGNSPDTQSDINFLEITSPSEPLLAGVMYDGYGFVYSSRRSFMLIPTFQSGALGFIARESANSRGIFSRWSICGGRDYIYYLTENADEIVRVAGSGNPQSITNGSLYNLFPHNGIDPLPIVLQFGVEAITILPPDFTRSEDLRLFHCRDFIFFRFVDLSGNAACLVFDERIGDWISYDTFPDGKINAFYAEELESVSDILMGVENGVGKYINDPTAREAGLKTIIVPFCADQGDSRVLKRYDEIVFDANTGSGGFDFAVFYNNGLLAEIPVHFQPAPPHVRRKFAKIIGDGTGVLARNISCKTEWRMDANTQIYEEQFYFIPRADQINDRASDLEDAGVFKDKFWQGIVIEADTFGVDKLLTFVDEDNNVRATLIINHTGKSTKSYSFNTPWISHAIMQKSADAVEWIFYRSEYKFDIEPELGKVWETQETSHGIPGFKVIERIGIVARTTSVATLKIYYDDSIEIYNLNNTVGDKRKQFFFVRARKGKLLKYRIEAESEFRIYENDLEIWIRQFNSPNFYQPIHPFGDQDSRTGATI